MAEAEQKKSYKTYLPVKHDKLSPYQKHMHGVSQNWVPASDSKDFDVNGSHESWVEICRKMGDSMTKALSVWPSPDAAFGEKTPYKKTVIAPNDENKLDCECLVFEPLEDAKNKLMFIYIHGGGMAWMDGKGVLEWNAATYAMEGHIGANVCFTNSVDECYPRGLNDTISAIKYLSETYKDKVNGICLHGESGGANLLVAAMMKLKQEEPEKDYVDCLYVECPYFYPTDAISTEKFATPEDIKGSVEEFAPEGYHMSKISPRCMFLAYKGPDRDEIEFLQDKFAWPYFAAEEDFKGFPPTFVQSNECDQLRDVGLRFYRQLNAAGVTAYHTTEGGTFHAGEKQSNMYNRMIMRCREAFLKGVLEEKAEAEAKAKAAEAEEKVEA